MVNIQIDKNEVREIVVSQVKRHIEQTHAEVFLWDMNELCRQTNLSKPFITSTFFHEEDFPKYRIGKKWVMVGEEVREYLKSWLKQQNGNLNK